jgi:hypothetical protein
LYTSAGLPKEAPERPAKEAREPGEEAERGRRAMGAAAPVAEPKGAPPIPGKGPTRTADVGAPGLGREGRELGAEPPVAVSAATIDEMLDMMAKQIMQLITWTQAEGFLDAYRHASPNARGLFHTAAIKLAARADQLRRG